MHNITRRQWLQAIGAAAIGAMTCRIEAATDDAAAPATRSAVSDVSDLVRTARGDDLVPGLWGAVTGADGLLAIGADGWRKHRANVPVTTNDCVHLGSCTKAMTAMLVGRLIESGKLTFDRTLGECFPDFAAGADPKTAAVTVRQLLEHRGGMVPNVPWQKFQTMAGPIAQRRRAIVQHAMRQPPRHPPGSTYEYSNVGYMTLGAMLEAAHGQDWESVITSELFKPLGMAGAGFGPPGKAGTTDQPWGHVERLGLRSAVQADNPLVLGPAGTVHCPIADWAKFVAWILRAEMGDTPLLTHATQATLFTPSAGKYAAGWQITDRPWAGGRTLVHAGDNTMWHCVAWLAPKRGFAVLAATNLSGTTADKVCDDLSAALIGWHRQRTA